MIVTVLLILSVASYSLLMMWIGRQLALYEEQDRVVVFLNRMAREHDRDGTTRSASLLREAANRIGGEQHR
jgi:hypothetical protein